MRACVQALTSALFWLPEVVLGRGRMHVPKEQVYPAVALQTEGHVKLEILPHFPALHLRCGDSHETTWFVPLHRRKNQEACFTSRCAGGAKG